MRTNPQPHRGFTLVELLVVIGIIMVLLGILLPAITGVQRAAREADTRSIIATLSQGVERYHSDHRAYPGPLSNDQIIAGGNALGLSGITMSENLTLGLLGGVNQPSPGTLTYDPNAVGLGPLNVRPGDTRRSQVYSDVRPGNELLSAGRFTDENGNQANDSVIPELLDRIGPPMPILYLRAAAGRAGVLSNNNAPDRFQYDLRMVLPYTNTSIGRGNHGLRDLGAMTDTIPSAGSTGATGLAFFKHPTLGGSSNAAGIPRQKDGYILISAGSDRRYGTIDDICSFGNLREE